MSLPEDIADILQADPPAQLRCAEVQAMTVNETAFFRDRKMFDVLRDTIVPRLIDANSTQRKLRIWSAAGSTGQEAYSLAMLLCEHFPSLADWDVRIIGTDIAHHVIAYARRGRYRRLEVDSGLPVRLLVKYLVHDGAEWEVVPKLRSMCSFQYADLCTSLPRLPHFDLVLLRNVLLFLAESSRGSVFQIVHRQMAPGAYLVLGASEQAEDSTDLFRAERERECYFYRPVGQLQD